MFDDHILGLDKLTDHVVSSSQIANGLNQAGFYGLEQADGSGFVDLSVAQYAPDRQELTELVHRITHRVAGFLEREGILERDEENSYLNLEEEINRKIYRKNIPDSHS